MSIWLRNLKYDGSYKQRFLGQKQQFYQQSHILQWTPGSIVTWPLGLFELSFFVSMAHHTWIPLSELTQLKRSMQFSVIGTAFSFLYLYVSKATCPLKFLSIILHVKCICRFRFVSLEFKPQRFSLFNLKSKKLT